MLLLYNDIYVEALGIDVPNKDVMDDSFKSRHDKTGLVESQRKDSTHPLPPPSPMKTSLHWLNHTDGSLLPTVAQSDTVSLSENTRAAQSTHFSRTLEERKIKARHCRNTYDLNIMQEASI